MSTPSPGRDASPLEQVGAAGAERPRGFVCTSRQSRVPCQGERCGRQAVTVGRCQCLLRLAMRVILLMVSCHEGMGVGQGPEAIHLAVGGYENTESARTSESLLLRRATPVWEALVRQQLDRSVSASVFSFHVTRADTMAVQKGEIDEACRVCPQF